MKVYIVTREPFPNGMAAVKRIICYAQSWKSVGVDCEVIIYTRTEKYGRKPKNISGHGEIDGVPYRYISDTPLRESNVVIRRINDYRDKIRLKKFLYNNLNSGDLVFAYNGNDPFSKDIIKVTHACNAYYAQELCELPFGTSEETKALVKKRKKFEKTLMPKFDGIIAISDALVDYARQHCSPNCVIVKVPILVDYPKYAMDDLSDESEIPYIFHSGTLFQQKDGILDVLKAFGKAVKRLPYPVNFISTGTVENSRHEYEIKSILKEYNIEERVIFTGYINNEQLRDYLAKACFVVINKLTTKQNMYCFSTKLGEYMAASKPIIITRVGEAMNYLTHGKDAYIIEPNDNEALADAMVKMFNDKDLRNRLSVNTRETCKESFTIKNNASVMKNLIDKNGESFL